MPKELREHSPEWKGNVVMRDANTDEIIYDNRDVVAMAKFSLQRGLASESLDNTEEASFVKWFEENHLMYNAICPGCKNPRPAFLGSEQVGQIFTDGTVGNRCTHCWIDYDLIPFSSDKDKLDYELKKPLIDKYILISCNDNKNRYSLLQNWIKDNNYNLEK